MSEKYVSLKVLVFYVIRLVPELDPGRVKFGFAESIRSRLSQHRTAAPTARVVKTWPCKRSWESTVIDYLSARGCRLISNEVFDCDDIDALLSRADDLFSLLPEPSRKHMHSSNAP